MGKTIEIDTDAPIIKTSTKRARKYVLQPLAVRFWAKVNSEGPIPQHVPHLGPCWVWIGSRDDKGYGQIREGGRGTPLLKAHRVAWALMNGPVAGDAVVMHRCDNPACVRAEVGGGGHLVLGTLSANTLDAVAKGRHVSRPPRGERASGAKLTEAQVRGIRARREEGWTQTQLAEVYGVSQQAISMLLSGRTWKGDR